MGANWPDDIERYTAFLAQDLSSMRLYVFETIQPDHIFAVIASDRQKAIDLVSEKRSEWNFSDAKISELKVGEVFHRRLDDPHIMGE